jgi:hypothetical protein
MWLVKDHTIKLNMYITLHYALHFLSPRRNAKAVAFGQGRRGYDRRVHQEALEALHYHISPQRHHEHAPWLQNFHQLSLALHVINSDVRSNNDPY